MNKKDKCECGKLKGIKSKKCKKCNMVGSNNINWIGGKPNCIECGIKLDGYKAKRCRKCNQKGETSPNWKGGKSIIFCIDCGGKVFYRKAKRCRKCFAISIRGEKNHLWKGDNAGYNAIHEWVRKNKPKPKLCPSCKKIHPKDLANISGKYKRNINDFEWLCRKCHMVKYHSGMNYHKNKK